RNEWSDRKLAELCGISATTVGRIRLDSCPTTAAGPFNKREGRDGRRRPVDPVAAGLRAEQAGQAHPDASLRNIAKLVGMSPSTIAKIRLEGGSPYAHRNGDEEPVEGPSGIGEKLAPTEEGLRRNGPAAPNPLTSALPARPDGDGDKSNQFELGVRSWE